MENQRTNDDVVEKFQAFCSKTTNKIVKRHQLLSTKQGCMTIDQYITSLHKIARECSLNEMYEDFMLQALLLGINDDRLRRKLFEESDELDLQNAVKKCKLAESSNADLKVIKAEADESVHALKYRGQPTRFRSKQGGDHTDNKQNKDHTENKQGKVNKPRSKCGNCGTSHPPRSCPAFGKQCRGCNKYNHFEKCCRSKRQINQLEDNYETETDSDESLMCIQVVRMNRKLLSTIETSYGKKKSSIQYQLDTGASCNIFNYQDYCALGRPPLNLNKRPTLQLFDGSSTRPLGQCEVTLAGHKHRFYVLKTKNISLLSVDACLDLGLLTVKPEWVNLVTSPSDIHEILDTYHEVFEGIGCLPGEYKIELDEEVTPRQCHNRKIALSMKKDLKTKLETLEQKGIVAKVDHPTPWISNIVPVRKPNGTIRVCIDPTNLNKVIKRNHFYMPTLDDVLPELDGAKVFSLCDAKDGFLQVKLDEASSDLTTFWTPFGKWKWLRMPFGLSSSPGSSNEGYQMH
jgi:hypothetical protein